MKQLYSNKDLLKKKKLFGIKLELLNYLATRLKMGILHDPAISKFLLQVLALKKVLQMYTSIQYIFIAALVIVIKKSGNNLNVYQL